MELMNLKSMLLFNIDQKLRLWRNSNTYSVLVVDFVNATIKAIAVVLRKNLAELSHPTSSTIYLSSKYNE
jgi:hypothetical protein